MSENDDPAPPDPTDPDATAGEPEPGIPLGVKLLIGVLFATALANRAQLVALGLLVFDITGEELDLGLLGLAEFLPIFLLAPFAGTMADRYDRRLVLAVGLVVELASTVGFLIVASGQPTSIAPILALAALFGVGRAITAPTGRALPIDMAPAHLVERVVALRSVAFQSAGIIGPMIAGIIFQFGRGLPFALGLVCFTSALGLLHFIPSTGIRRLQQDRAGPTQVLRDTLEGLRYIGRTPVLRGAMTLDLFAVLFGGAVALLPAIGEKRLGVDEAAVGFLYSAIGVGALITSGILSIRPIRRHIGITLFGVIAVFGTATIVLGLTTSYVVALGALLVLSAADAVSVFIRATLVPLASPESMRGRVLAVENVFIGGSNELGAMESGLTAAWFGLVPAVVLGGVGTLAVMAVGMVVFPDLRRVQRFEDVRPVEPSWPDTS